MRPHRTTRVPVPARGRRRLTVAVLVASSFAACALGACAVRSGPDVALLWASTVEMAPRGAGGDDRFVETDAGVRCYGLAVGDALGRDDDEPEDEDGTSNGTASADAGPASSPAAITPAPPPVALDAGPPPRPSDCELAMRAREVTPPSDDLLGEASVRSNPARRQADLVVLVSVDGLRPDALGRQRTKLLWSMRKQGLWASRARTIRRAITLPSHTSMLTGLPPTSDSGPAHGVMWNRPDATRGIVRAPTIFRIARRAGLFTAMVVAKKKFFHLIEPFGVAEYRRPGSVGLIVARDAERVIERATAPGLVFVHFGDPDNYGHSSGWMRSQYMQAVSRVDGYVRHLTDAVARRPRHGHERVLFIVTADHGGHSRGHTGAVEVDRMIPWFAWGDGVRRGTLPETREVSTLDTAATTLWALGIDVPRWMAGRPVTEVYEGGAGRAPRAPRRPRGRRR